MAFYEEQVNRYLSDLQKDAFFQKVVLILKKLINKDNDSLILKITKAEDYQVVYKTDDGKINFAHMAFEQKRKFIIKLIC